MNGSDSTSTKERLVWKTARFEIKIRTGYDIRLERERGGNQRVCHVVGKVDVLFVLMF